MFHESSLTNRDFLDPRRLTTEHIVTLDDLLDMGVFHERNHLPVGSILEDVGLGVRREGGVFRRRRGGAGGRATEYTDSLIGRCD